MSALWGKADIPDTPYRCPLMTHSGHAILTERRRDAHFVQSMKDDPRALQREPRHNHQRPVRLRLSDSGLSPP
jgi:hypothetical protein